MKFATIDEKGWLTGFYGHDHPAIPNGAFEISEDAWIDWLGKQHSHRWEKSKLVEADGDVDDAKLSSLLSIDALAENARLKYLTPGLGQTLAYQAKAEEVRRYDQDTNPVKADYPYMSAEIGVTGDSLTAVADAVRSAVAVWAEKGPEIERTRLKAKSDIAKAETVDRIQAIVSAIEWP